MLRALRQKNHLKKFQKILHEIFFLNIFGYRGCTANLGYACKNLGCLRPLVWQEIETAQTVVIQKLKFIYRLCGT
jgi:hypothetical protein